METGDSLPEFELPINGGKVIRHSDLAGKWVIIYFYPKDLTPGCTTEAINFSDMFSEFEKRNAYILGISKDNVSRHEKFIEKHDLKITLAADENDFCERFGVWVEKSMYGKKYMGIERSTFLFSPDGKLAHIWRKVKVKEHADDVLQTLERLQA